MTRAKRCITTYLTFTKLGSCITRVLLSEAFDESDLDKTDKECLQELNIDKSVVIKAYDRNGFIKERSADFNRFYACVWKIDEIQNADGSIELPRLADMVALKLVKLFPGDEKLAYRFYLSGEGVYACENIKGRDDDDTRVKIYNCILEKVGEVAQKVTPEEFNKN